MKFSAVAALTVAALAHAQTRDDIPKCALPCLDKAISGSTKCSTTDFACICKEENFSAVQGSATGCVLKECGQDVALTKVLPATQALCKNAGKGDSKPSSSAAPSEPASSSAPAASPSAPASGSSSAAPSQSAEPSESAEPTGTAEPTETAQPTQTGSQSCSTTLVPTHAPTAPSNGTAPPPVTAGAAGVAPAGGLALLALGALLL